MREIERRYESVRRQVLHQLHNLFVDIDEEIITAAIPAALAAVEKNFLGLKNSRLKNEDDIVFSIYHSVSWMIFLYRLSHELGTNQKLAEQYNGVLEEADKVYYLNKALHAIDWYHQINLPEHFMCEHPLGSVLGRADYGDHLMVYQGTTVGGNRKGDQIFYPSLGDNVVLYANATILGDCRIGNNVIISAGSYLMNEVIPDHCIVFGKSPNLTIKRKTQEEIRSMTSHIWNWENDL